MRKDILDAMKLIAKKIGLTLRKKAPTILVTVGVVGVGATVVVACKETLEVQDDISKTMEVVTELKNAKEDYPAEEYGRDLRRRYGEVAKVVAVHYYPAVILGAISVTCIGSSHYILSKRLAGWIAAYGVLYKDFQKYREQVISEQGKEKDVDYLSEVNPPAVYRNKDRIKRNVYSRVFDENSSEFIKHEPNYNLEFLTEAENHFNRKLKNQGYVLLNEVLLYLDIPTIDTDYGWNLGWVLWNGEDPENEPHIDFGVWDITNPQSRAFINGYEEAIWLDFNIDGDVTDWLWMDGVDLSKLKGGEVWPH